jgi:phosphoglycolate phosphatase-like HAD superfamily hydrolase
MIVGSNTIKRNNIIAYQAIFFDFDGVIVESTDIKSQAFCELYAEHVEALDDVIAYHIAHEGISRLEKILYCHENFLGIKLGKNDLVKLASKYSALVKQAVIDCDSVPGSLDFLQDHHATLPMFVVSGTPEGELKEIVELRGLKSYFTSVHGSPQHKAPIVNEQIKIHGFDRDQCLFVGDAMADYDAAMETGLTFIGRVEESHINLFPNGTTIIKDLTELAV